MTDSIVYMIAAGVAINIVSDWFSFRAGRELKGTIQKLLIDVAVLQTEIAQIKDRIK